MITREQIESVKRSLANKERYADVDLDAVDALVRLGLCVVEAKVTVQALGDAAEVCANVKRFDGNSGGDSERKRRQAIKMLNALAKELER